MPDTVLTNYVVEIMHIKTNQFGPLKVPKMTQFPFNWKSPPFKVIKVFKISYLVHGVTVNDSEKLICAQLCICDWIKT